MRPRHGVVLAGGASRRMGRDKALLEIAGEPLLARQVALLRSVGLEPLVAGRPSPADAAWRGLPDRTPGEGPLAAVVGVLAELRSPVLVVAVDAPRLRGAHLAWLLAQADAGPGVVAAGADGPDPTFAIYAPEALPAAEVLLAQGRRALHRLIPAAGLRVAALPPALTDGLRGCNTEAEWRAFVDEG